MKYCNDGDNEAYPWYDKKQITTIEGPTSKHTIVQQLVRVFTILKKSINLIITY